MVTSYPQGSTCDSGIYLHVFVRPYPKRETDLSNDGIAYLETATDLDKEIPKDAPEEFDFYASDSFLKGTFFQEKERFLSRERKISFCIRPLSK